MLRIYKSTDVYFKRDLFPGKIILDIDSTMLANIENLPQRGYEIKRRLKIIAFIVIGENGGKQKRPLKDYKNYRII